MQKKDYFHELAEPEKKFYFFTELYTAYPRVRFFMATVLTIVGVTDLILRLMIYPLLHEGKPYPMYTPALIPWLFCMISFILNLLTYPRISEKRLTRIRQGLSYITTLGGGAYHYLIILDFLQRALDAKDPEDWTFSLITISNSVHQTVFITIVTPSWPYTVFCLACSYAGVISAYIQSEETLRYWVLIKSVANIFYTTLFVLVGTYYRWKNFLKYSEAEAWNQVYNDTLDRIPSAIAVMNVSGQLIYSNAEFKTISMDNSEKLFRSITNLKPRDIPLVSTTEGFFPKTLNDDFAMLTTRNRYPGTPTMGSYYMLKNKDLASPRSTRFNKLEDLLEHYRALLMSNSLKNEGPVVYDSKMEIKTLIQRHVYSYEITIRPLVEYKKIVIILNNTTQRDLVASLEDNNDYKDKLLASISHELRTPLNGNLVLLQAAVQEDNVPKSVKEKLLMPALRSGRLLSHLISDILDYSTMLADKITLYCENRPMKESLEYCYQLFEHTFKAKQLKFNLIIDSSVPHLFCTDHQRLIQVILNLLSNALKFTFNGGVTMKAKTVKENPSAIEISISDTGIGMSKDTLRKLFEEDLISTRSQESINCKGVGLGLTVTSNLIKMLGPERGDGLQVESVDGKGSKFSFEIAKKGCDVEEDEEKLMNEFDRSNGSLPDIPAELVEDNKHINVGKIKRSKFKHAVIKSASKFDIKRIKEISASCRIGRALIVDDDQINILALEILLKQLKIGADSAYNGKQGIEKVLAHPDKYQIIFMDCQMPVMDGFEATKQLIEKMQNEEIPIIPIIGCTAFSAKNKIEECMNSGMVEVINKPVLKEKLKQILDKYI